MIGVFAQFQANQLLVSRIHIYRKDEDTIQIYKDIGNKYGLHFGVGAKAGVPVLTLSFSNTNGETQTKFHTLKLDDSKVRSALRSLLYTGSLELVNALQKPYISSHHFNEQQGVLGFLPWRYSHLNQKDSINIIHPSGSAKSYFRHVTGEREGINYQDFTLEAVNSLLSDLFGIQNITISNQSGSNPGDTFFGKSHTRLKTFEAEILPEGSTSCRQINNTFFSYAQIWKGWSIDQKQAIKIISNLEKKYSFNLYNDLLFQETKNILLYKIRLQHFIYEQGMESLLQLNMDQIIQSFIKTPRPDHIRIYPEKCFRDLGSMKRLNVTESHKLDGLPDYCFRGIDSIKTWINEVHENITTFIHAQRRAMDQKQLCRVKDYASAIQVMMQKMDTLPIEEIARMIGGKNNMYLYSDIQGFREGDEAGDRPLYSNAIGNFASSQYTGPIQYIRSKLDMTESEFYSYWFMEQL